MIISKKTSAAPYQGRQALPEVRRLRAADRDGQARQRDGPEGHMDELGLERRERDGHGRGHRRVEGRQGHGHRDRGRRERVRRGHGRGRREAADDGVVQAVEDGQAGHGVLARVHEPELDRQREDDPGVRRLVEGDRARHEGRADGSRVRAGRQVVRQQRRQAVRGQGRHTRRGRRPVHPGRHTKLRDNHQTIIK